MTHLIRGRTTSAIVGVVFAGFLGGCLHPPAETVPLPEPVELMSSPTMSWYALVDVLTELQFVIEEIVPEAGYLQTTVSLFPEPQQEAWWNCGPTYPSPRGPRFDPRRNRNPEPYVPESQLTASVVPAGASVRIRVVFTNPHLSDGQPCASRGTLESTLYKLIEARARELSRAEPPEPG